MLLISHILRYDDETLDLQMQYFIVIKGLKILIQHLQSILFSDVNIYLSSLCPV